MLQMFVFVLIFEQYRKSFQAELKNLQDIASPSFLFARDLVKHNLVRIQRFCSYRNPLNSYTVKFLNVKTPTNFAVNTLKF